MKAALFIAPGSIELTEKNLEAPLRNELLVRIDTCGVCGTDFHIYNGLAPAKNNIILGHELSGVVVDKGKDCNDVAIGDGVAIDPNIYCGKCDYCRKGKVQFCLNHKALGVTLNGGFAEYVLAPVSQAHIIPTNFPLDIAAYAEPLSCCIRGIDKAEVNVGENIIIVGGGAIGLMMMQLAKISGASRVVLIEPDEHRRILGKELGADFVASPTSHDLNEEIENITKGGADTIIECVGKPEAVGLGISLAKRGGKIIVFGMAPVNSKLELNLHQFFQKELSIISSFLNPFTFGRAVNLLIDRKILVERFSITKLSFENLLNVFTLNNKTHTLKYQFQNQ